jgi:hypothetical protein
MTRKEKRGPQWSPLLFERDKLTLNLPLGDKERYKAHAESKGKSLTALIVELLEDDIKKSE